MNDPGRYPIPAPRVHRVKETIQRSGFTTTFAHATDADAAHAFVRTIREEFPDATHNCWAIALQNAGVRQLSSCGSAPLLRTPP